MSIPSFYQKYIDQYHGNTLVQEVLIQGDLAIDFYRKIPESMGNFRYDTGKWSIREILGHILDGERVFAYRILRFARNDKTALSGFEQDDYIPEMNLGNRGIFQLTNEFANLRATTVDLFQSLNEEMLNRTGTASGVEFRVEELCKILIGHEIHHRNIIAERYLKD